jgi:hypothetical protein
MYYQERGEVISNQIIFRCFGENFEKLLILREKRENEENYDREKNNFNNCGFNLINSTAENKRKKIKKLDYINFKTFNLKAKTTRIAVEQFRDKVKKIYIQSNLYLT